MSEVKTMTVHSALAYLKIADKRIESALKHTFVTCAQVNSTKIQGISAADFRNAMASDYKSVCDITNNVIAIKKALSESNAKTMITVCGETMSVAAAIYMMKYGVSQKEAVLKELRSQYAAAMQIVSKRNGKELDERAETYIRTLYTNKEGTSGEDALKSREQFKAVNSFEVVDSIHIAEEIKKLSDWIDTFKAEIDGALQVSNAVTTITVEM